METDTIIRKVVEAFQDLEVRLQEAGFEERDEEWTREVLTTLCTLGREYGCSVGASPKAVRGELRDGREWLYDVHWVAYDDHGWLSDLVLAAESEWGDVDHIGADFQKLLVSRAVVRVMVYQGGSRKKSRDAVSIANKLAEYVGAFRGQRGDTYLLVAYEENESGWSFIYHEILAQEPGERPIMRRLWGP